MMRIHWVLKYMWLCSGFLVEGAVWDPNCIDNCNCCRDSICHNYQYFWNDCPHGCIDGHRGARCYELCEHNCTSCDTSVTICDKCYDGFHLGPNKDCTSECPTNCRACISNTMCTACKDGYYDKDGSTTCPHALCPENCNCIGYTCSTCKKGFYGTGNECSKECPANCKSCASQEICNVCKNGFYNGYEFDNNIKKLFNNCTFRCRESCTECLSYDNCLQCVKGKYSPKCHKYCSVGCKDQTCYIESGKCSCLSNFNGDKCTDCITGKYGPYCNETCTAQCKNGKCNKTSGYCSEGCITDTITGETCNVCALGMHGIVCNKTCPLNCKGKTCNRKSGFCSWGCEDNFEGPFCDTCIQGKYGSSCKQNCSLKCTNALCENETGNCFSCTANFDGDRCNTCKNGFYGRNCISLCPSQCFNKSCDIKSGKCDFGCTINYSGDKCCVKSDKCIECFSGTECQKCKSGYFSKLCEKTCSANCLDSCDISTGVCSDCIINHFGPFCNLKCSENCNVSRSSATRDCASSDGICMFGCKQGFFGLKCNETCSSLCIDTLCRQESGICVKGCTGANDDPICVLSLGKPQDVSDKKSTTAYVVFATLFAVTSTALFVLILKKMIKKTRFSVRQTVEFMIRHRFQNSQNEDTDTCGNTDYMNLRIQAS
ncbi:multiple epidermal growth factor-like domains protein 10 isoform X2 [Mercenaria mercenaria]|uniref:multiple epidermal growth factor-like domains protein 10 isoform X2 n=1 Tax=Mercenaria mercenaria TaxID=6596 RepID=UPI00234E7EE1|nr:multiple epidermal growth factor-like domains protein 10 isoform X2 [Mercenaria mercenaria]